MAPLMIPPRDIPIIHERPEGETETQHESELCYPVNENRVYQLVRVSRLNCHVGRNIPDTFDACMEGSPAVLCMTELSDESWEILVLSACRWVLLSRLHYFFPGSYVDLAFDPAQPTRAQAHQMGYHAAKHSAQREFVQRARNIIKTSCPIAACLYRQLVMQVTGGILPPQLHIPDSNFF